MVQVRVVVADSRGFLLERLKEAVEVGLDAGELGAGAARAVRDYLHLLLDGCGVVVLVLAVQGYLKQWINSGDYRVIMKYVTR